MLADALDPWMRLMIDRLSPPACIQDLQEAVLAQAIVAFMHDIGMVFAALLTSLLLLELIFEDMRGAT